jgi:hypothetical protein
MGSRGEHQGYLAGTEVTSELCASPITEEANPIQTLHWFVLEPVLVTNQPALVPATRTLRINSSQTTLCEWTQILPRPYPDLFEGTQTLRSLYPDPHLQTTLFQVP